MDNNVNDCVITSFRINEKELKAFTATCRSKKITRTGAFALFVKNSIQNPDILENMIKQQENVVNFIENTPPLFDKIDSLSKYVDSINSFMIQIFNKIDTLESKLKEIERKLN